MVGNGEHIQCQGFYPKVLIHIQASIFSIPFYLLPIEGVDVALGIEWLQTLGLITTDFSIPSISFTLDNTPFILQGDPPKLPFPTTYQ